VVLASFLALLLGVCLAPAASAQESGNTPAAAQTMPRGKKLVLKDGTFQVVREYQIEGDRVRYFSLDTGQWEQLPAELVDWDATKKIENEQAATDAAALAKVHKQEEARRAEPLDIDASLEVAPGVFLPPGENLFVFDGKAVLPLTQAETTSKLSKGRTLEQIMVPVPIIPTRHTVSIAGSRAKFRVRNPRPEFYMRTVDARTPMLELIRAKLHGNNREIEHLDELLGAQNATRNTLLLQRWEIARGVYRFTLGQPLEPGEYVFAEILESEGTSLYVWDFGVDGNSAAAAKQK
jgi:hypothetical protein